MLASFRSVRSTWPLPSASDKGYGAYALKSAA